MIMKQLVLIIHDNLKQDTADLLRAIDQIQGFTFTSIEGHGEGQFQTSSLLVARDKVVGFTPHTRVDILLQDNDVSPVLTALRQSDIGLKQNSIYWVTCVDELGRL